MGFLSNDELEAIGFDRLGSNVLISDKISIYNPKNISIGSNVRIDDFCVISVGHGGITIGNNVHIAVGASLIGAGKITLSNFVNISSRVAIYSSNDDYSGATMTGPTLPTEFTNIRRADVFLGKHVIVGTGSVILPGLTLEDGVAVGALSLVTKNCMAFGIYAGIPAQRIKERKQDLLILEEQYLATKTK